MAKFEEKTEATDGPSRPPYTIDRLQNEFARLRRAFRNRRKAFPQEVPYEPREAAGWWVGMQKPANADSESPRLLPVTGKGTSSRWVTPYAERLIASLRKYVQLSDAERQFVIAAREDGVWYNGDEFEFFQRVYDETMKMRSAGAKQYQAEAMVGLKRLVGGMT